MAGCVCVTGCSPCLVWEGAFTNTLITCSQAQGVVDRVSVSAFPKLPSAQSNTLLYQSSVCNLRWPLSHSQAGQLPPASFWTRVL